MISMKCNPFRKIPIDKPIYQIVEVKQINNIEAFRTIKFKKCDFLPEDHFIKFIKLKKDDIPDENIFCHIFHDIPKIIISVNAEDELDLLTEEDKNNFKQAFKNILFANNQWVIGTGLQIGINRLISEAVQESRFENEDKQIKLLGFSDFSKIENFQSIIPTKCPVKTHDYKSNLKLDPHYNCMIFHDFECRKRIENVHKLRMNFEDYCSKMFPKNLCKFQVFCAGNQISLEWTLESMKRDTYIVVIKGSGGMADIICSIINSQDYSIENINNKLSKSKYEDSDECIKLLQSFLNFKKRIVIYDMKNKKERLDKKIFEVIKSNEQNVKLEEILLLSLSFKEDVIIEAEIFQNSDFSKLIPEQRKEILMAILRSNKPDVLKLFLKKENLKKIIFNDKDLDKLYEESINAGIGSKKLLKEERTINKRFYSNKNKKHFDGVKDKEEDCTFGIAQKNKNFDTVDNEDPVKSKKKEKRVKFVRGTKEQSTSKSIQMTNPIYNSDNSIKSQDLFVWALLSGYFEIAFIIWKKGNNHISTALKGSIILKNISKCFIDLSQMSEKYFKESELYRNIAINIMTETFNKNRLIANLALLRPIDEWNNMSCLEIAVNGEVREFCNLNVCLIYAKCTWKGKKEILTRQFEPGSSTENIDEQRKFSITEFKEAAKSYILSPIMKFIVYMIFYFLFLAFFMDVNLVRLNPIGKYVRKFDMWTEIYVYFYIFGFIIEEINQLGYQTQSDFNSKWKTYIAGPWNFYDCVIIFLFAISTIIRFTIRDQYFVIVRCLFAIILSMFWIRSMQFCFISRSLGPKIIMIKRMIIDIVFFMLIFFIFVVAYGSLAQSLQHPNSPLSFSLINDILYKPYFHVYGELMLDEYSKFHCNSTSCSFRDQTVIIAFGLFLLLTTILLVNLLIAMFGYTFNSIQMDVVNHFALLQFQLLVEFHNKSYFPPPFNIISLLIIKSLGKCAFNSSENILVRKSDTVQLMTFEKSVLKSSIQKLRPITI